MGIEFEHMNNLSGCNRNGMELTAVTSGRDIM